jgi:branched-chain amino acid transport system ATP-binding protein
MTPILAAHGLHTYYGKSHILRGIDLAIGPGETVGLMGRNGMGKTTLLRSLLGLVPIAQGSIAIAGADASRLPTFRRAELGLAYVPEGRGIFASLSVTENLAIAERLGHDGARAWTLPRVLELFPRLGQRRAHRGDQLSGGEQQMLAIARALLTNPRLLILDEATEGLAPIVRDEIWRTLGTIKASGLATFLVDKTVHEVTAIADRCIILVKGRIVLDTTPAALLAAPDVMHKHLGV